MSSTHGPSGVNPTSPSPSSSDRDQVPVWESDRKPFSIHPKSGKKQKQEGSSESDDEADTSLPRPPPRSPFDLASQGNLPQQEQSAFENALSMEIEEALNESYQSVESAASEQNQSEASSGASSAQAYSPSYTDFVHTITTAYQKLPKDRSLTVTIRGNPNKQGYSSLRLQKISSSLSITVLGATAHTRNTINSNRSNILNALKDKQIAVQSINMQMSKEAGQPTPAQEQAAESKSKDGAKLGLSTEEADKADATTPRSSQKGAEISTEKEAEAAIEAQKTTADQQKTKGIGEKNPLLIPGALKGADAASTSEISGKPSVQKNENLNPPPPRTQTTPFDLVQQKSKEEGSKQKNQQEQRQDKFVFQQQLQPDVMQTSVGQAANIGSLPPTITDYHSFVSLISSIYTRETNIDGHQTTVNLRDGTAIEVLNRGGTLVITISTSDYRIMKVISDNIGNIKGALALKNITVSDINVQTASTERPEQEGWKEDEQGEQGEER